MLTVSQIKTQVLPILKAAGVKRSALFGSCVRGEMNPKSDIDFLVDLPKNKTLFDFLRLKIELQKVLRREVDLVEYNTVKPFLRERIFAEQQMIL